MMMMKDTLPPHEDGFDDGANNNNYDNDDENIKLHLMVSSHLIKMIFIIKIWMMMRTNNY